jgi:DNA polymerase III gamma/tau subunit
LQLIARHAQGGLRDAITTFDQIRRAGEITETLVTKSLGLLSSVLIEEFVTAYQAGDQNAVTTSIQNAYAKGAHMKHFLQSILDYIKHEVFATASDRTLTQDQFATLITLAEGLMTVKFVFPGQEAFEMQMAVLRTMGTSPSFVSPVAPVSPIQQNVHIQPVVQEAQAPKPAFRKREVEPSQAPISDAVSKPAFSARPKYVAPVETPEAPVKPTTENPLLEKALSLFSDPS